MSWTWLIKKNKKGEKYYVHTSFRKGNSVSSTNCGFIDDIERLKKEKGNEFDSYIQSEGERIYQEWKDKEKPRHQFTFKENAEQENYREIYTSQIYLRKIWNDIGLTETLNSIKKTNKLKYQYDLNELAFFLVTNQLISASSKLKAYQERSSYFFSPENMTIDSVYDCLDVLAKNCDLINLKTYKKAKKYLKKDSALYFYDVTSVNMSKTVECNDLIGLKKGKEGIFGPIIQIGYLCDEWGLIIGMHVFKGSANEQGSLKEQMTRLYGVTKLKNIVICTDAGLCSIKNKRYSSQNFKGYITTQPLTKKKISDEIRKWAVECPFKVDGEKLSKQQIIERYEALVEEGKLNEADTLAQRTFYKSDWYLTTIKINSKGEEKLDGIKAKNKQEGESIDDIRKMEIELPKKGQNIEVTFEQRLVVSFSLKYYFAQKKKLEEEKEKAIKAIEKKQDLNDVGKKDFKRFVKCDKVTKNGEVAEENANTFLQDEYDYEESLCGLYCQATNLADNETVIYQSSRGRWIIEYLFRTCKSYLNMGTVYLHLEDHIIGHFEIVLLAINLLMILAYKVYAHLGNSKNKMGKGSSLDKEENFDVTLIKIIEKLCSMKSGLIKDDNGIPCLISHRNKNDINKIFSEIFRFSLTTQVRPVDQIKKLIRETDNVTSE